MGAVLIRGARIDDAAAVQAIYAPIVEDTAISFELTPPTVAEVGARIQRITSRHPWQVAEVDDCVVGYAYADSHSDRGAYRWTVSTSIYIGHDWRAQGIGRRLYAELIDVLARLGSCGRSLASPCRTVPASACMK